MMNLNMQRFNPERNIVKEVVQDYLNGIDSDLINLSKELARQLFIIMKGKCKYTIRRFNNSINNYRSRTNDCNTKNGLC